MNKPIYSFIMMLCIITVLTFTGCGNHDLKDPALDISNASPTEFSDLDEEMMLVIINGVKFENEVPYYPVDGADKNAMDYAGDVVSYFVNDDHYVFYCKADGMDPEKWLIKVTDDGKSNLQEDEACFIKAVDVNEVPDWLTKITYDFFNDMCIINGYEAEHLEYKPANDSSSAAGELYYINPYFLGDFFEDKETEGGAWWTDESKGCIQFSFTIDNGGGGAAAGQTVNVIMDLNENEITESDFTGFESQPFTDDELLNMGKELAEVLLGAEKQLN